MGIGDWGLGIGDWGLAQSPIPNPQSPIPNPQLFYSIISLIKIIKLIININNYLIINLDYTFIPEKNKNLFFILIKYKTL